MAYIIGIDQSTQGTKALLFDDAGKTVLRVDKGSAMDLANLGLCEKFMGNAEQAREYLSAALELDASLDFARNHLAELEGQAN